MLTQTTASDPIATSERVPTDAVIDAVVAIGGLDQPGARRIVASTLGYTPDTLPASVDFHAEHALP